MSDRFSFLKNRSFICLQLGKFNILLTAQILAVVVGWHIYELTGEVLDLGLAGLSMFLPTFFFAVIGGDLADRFNKKFLIIIAYSILMFACFGLFWVASQPNQNISLIYASLMLLGLARSLGGPASTSLLPFVVPRQHFAQAVAFGSALWQFTAIGGPAAGGFLFAYLGAPQQIYLLVTILVGIALVAAGMISTSVANPMHFQSGIHSPPALAGMWQRIIEGLKFVRNEQILLGAISLDLFAVLLGGAVALLPVYAKDVLHLGPSGLGLLRAAPAVGAATMAALLMIRPLRHGVGVKMFSAVAVFGIATCVFAVSKSIWLSMSALFVLGAADMVSVVIRHTLVQAHTPDAMRGRVTAVNQVFVGASNELGEFESGVTAHFLGIVPAALLGGVGTLVVAAVWWRLFPKLSKVQNMEFKS